MAPEPHHDTRSDAELARRLRTNHITLRTEPIGAERVVTAARRRTRRRRAALAGAAVVAVLAVATTFVTARRDQPNGTDVATDGRGTAVATEDTAAPEADRPGADDPDSDLEWGASADGGLYGVDDSAVGADGSLFSLAVDPDLVSLVAADPGFDGLRTPMALYRLGDDGTWAPSPMPAAMIVDDLAADGERLRAIGTTADARAVVVSTSVDGGETWDTEELPVSADVPSDAIRWQLYAETSIDTSGGSTLAVVESTYEPADWSELFPEWDTTTELRFGPNIAISGDRWVHARAADGLVLESAAREQPFDDVDVVGWSELGLQHPVTPDVLTVDAYVWSGGAWEPVTLPLPGGEVRAADGGFVMYATVPDPDPPPNVPYDIEPLRTAAFWSRDGRTWNPLEVPDGTTSVNIAGDALVATGRVLDPEDPPERHTKQAEHTIAVSHDRGSSWTPVDLGALDERIADALVGEPITGPLGVAIPVLGATDDSDTYGSPHVFWTNHLRDQYLLVSSDLVSWEVVAIADLVDEIGDDEPVELHPVIGDDRIALSVTFASWVMGELGPEGTADPGDPAVTFVGLLRD
ncbi:MAG: hypothetical protein S0880_27540 [Actinomycetota bacterium]|nr:hypothetical protein [Actinomycetota bacterium]